MKYKILCIIAVLCMLVPFAVLGVTASAETIPPDETYSYWAIDDRDLEEGFYSLFVNWAPIDPDFRYEISYYFGDAGAISISDYTNKVFFAYEPLDEVTIIIYDYEVSVEISNYIGNYSYYFYDSQWVNIDFLVSSRGATLQSLVSDYTDFMYVSERHNPSGYRLLETYCIFSSQLNFLGFEQFYFSVDWIGLNWEDPIGEFSENQCLIYSNLNYYAQYLSCDVDPIDGDTLTMYFFDDFINNFTYSNNVFRVMYFFPQIVTTECYDFITRNNLFDTSVFVEPSSKNIWEYYGRSYINVSMLNAFYGFNFPTITDPGYDQGYNTGYNSGYQSGYSDGFNVGNNNLTQHAQNAYNQGYQDGLTVSETGNFNTLITSVFDGLVNTITGLFDFTFLGYNMFTLVKFIFTVLIIIYIVRFAGGIL